MDSENSWKIWNELITIKENINDITLCSRKENVSNVQQLEIEIYK